tara:strand:+ start:1803 stop:2477 length:675 start_codon:yes stop_codon:yes gene_type:complete
MLLWSLQSTSGSGDAPEEEEEAGDEPVEESSDESPEGDEDLPLTLAQQRKMDRSWRKRLERNDAKHRTAAENAEKEGIDRANAERDTATKRAETVSVAASKAMLSSAIRAAAITQGVSADNVAKVMKLVDRDGINVDYDEGDETDEAAFKIDGSTVTAAVAAVLVDIPELGKSGKKAPTAKDDHSGDGGQMTSFTVAQIKSMSDEELDKNRSAIMKATAAGLVK